MAQTLLSRVRAQLSAALSVNGKGAPASLPERAPLPVLIKAARDARLADAEINRAVAQALEVPYAEVLSSYPTSADFVARHFGEQYRVPIVSRWQRTL